MLEQGGSHSVAARMGWPEGALEPMMVQSPTSLGPPPPPASDIAQLDAMLMDVLGGGINSGSHSPDASMDSESAQLAALLDELNIIATSGTLPADRAHAQHHLHNGHSGLCPAANAGSMDLLAGAHDPSQTAGVFQQHLGKFERGSARRATIQLGQIRNGRVHSIPPYMRRLQDSASTSPLARTPSQQSLALATQAMPGTVAAATPTNTGAGAPGTDTLAALQLHGLIQDPASGPLAPTAHQQQLTESSEAFVSRPNSIQRRNTINLGRFDNMRQERRHHLYHTPPVELSPHHQQRVMASMSVNDVIGALYSPPDGTGLLGSASGPVNTLDVTLEDVNAFLNEALVRPHELGIVDDLYQLGSTPTIIDTPPHTKKAGPKAAAAPKTPAAAAPTSADPTTPGVTTTAGSDDGTAGSDEQPKKVRRRRTFAELRRDVLCPFPGCERVYASTHSLQQHFRLKHPGQEPPVRASQAQAQGSPPEKSHSQSDSLESTPVASAGATGGSAAKQRKRTSSLPFLDLDILSKLRLGKKSSSSSTESQLVDSAQPHPSSFSPLGAGSLPAPGGNNPFDVGRSPPLLLATEAILEEMFRS